MTTHNPQDFVTLLSAKLAARSRHVCLLLGAGVSRSCGLPDVHELQEKILGKLDKENRDKFSLLLKGRNIEQALGRLRRIAALLDEKDTIGGLTGGDASALDAIVCAQIIKALDISAASIQPVHLLSVWAGRASYHLPVELFTVNYDLLLETALEKVGVPYFDGFVGNLRARFRPDLVEASPGTDAEWVPSMFVRLWKLHGSLNWEREKSGEVVRLGCPIPDGLAAAIYPSDEKYEESRRVPFLVLQDRFRRAINQPETITLVSGYSFGDDHINELIVDAAIRRERSEFVVFCYADIPPLLEKRASEIPNIQVVNGKEAILGGVRADWKPTAEVLPSVWDDGKFVLADFSKLAVYLALSASQGQYKVDVLQQAENLQKANG